MTDGERHPDYQALLRARQQALVGDSPFDKALYHLFSDTAEEWGIKFSDSLATLHEYYYTQYGDLTMPMHARMTLADAAAAGASYSSQNIIDLAKAYVTLT